MNKASGEPFVVKYVDFTTTKLVDSNHQYHISIGIVEAKQMAQDAGLDLVCFGRPQQGDLALCKIINFGKWKYSNEKQKKKQAKGGRSETKEIRLSPDIGDHDVEHKLKHVKEFLEDGDEVILEMRLKGRQRAHFPEAEKRMNEVVAICAEYAKEVSRKKGSNMIIVRLSSNK